MGVFNRLHGSIVVACFWAAGSTGALEALLCQLRLDVGWLALEHQRVEAAGLFRLRKAVQADVAEQQGHKAAPSIPGRRIAGILWCGLLQFRQQPHRDGMGVGVALVAVSLFGLLVTRLEVPVQKNGAL